MVPLYLAFFALNPFVAAAHGQTWVTENGHVEFHSRVPLHDFTGSSDLLHGLINLDEGKVDFYVDLETLDTGNGKRDRDMRQTLDTRSHPFAEFTGRLRQSFDPMIGEPQPVSATGTFTIHGVSRDLSVDGTITVAGDNVELRTTWKLSLDDYDIKPPRLLILKVADQQEIEIRATLERQHE